MSNLVDCLLFTYFCNTKKSIYLFFTNFTKKTKKKVEVKGLSNFTINLQSPIQSLNNNKIESKKAKDGYDHKELRSMTALRLACLIISDLGSIVLNSNQLFCLKNQLY